MKILVTGGAGFIGSNYIRYILDNFSHEVINLDALTYAGCRDTLLNYETRATYTFVHGDINDKALVDRLVSEVDCIVHFAAESHVDRSIDDSFPFAVTNILGTLTLLDSAQKNGNKRFHHISTDEVFGELHETGTFSENSAYNPRSPYSASKASADHFVRAYFHTYGLPVTISHCSNNYGPFQHPEKFISKAITDVIEGRPISIYGEGLNIRDWIHVEDHVRGIQAVIENGRIGDSYCFGGKSEMSNNQVALELVKYMSIDNPNIEYVADRKGHDFRYAVDIEKVFKELNWEPTHTFTSGLISTIQWYRDNEPWWQAIKNRSQ